MKKILVLFKSVSGGSGMAIKSLLHVRDERLKLVFYSFEKPKESLFLSKKINFFNPIYPSNSLPSFLKLKVFIKNIFSLIDIIKKDCFDIFLVGDIYTFYLVHFAHLFLGRKNNRIIFRISAPITDYLALKPLGWYRALLYFLYRKFSKKTKYFIFTSNKAHDDFKTSQFSNKNAKYFTIYNGIDDELIKKMSSKKISKNEDELFNKKYFKIISVGRFTEEKDYTTTLYAFKSVINSYPLCRLFIIGNGHLFRETASKIDLMGLGKNVFLLGWKNNVFPYLKRANLFIHSAKYEGFGYVLIEAMSQGLPVISTNSPFGPREILNNGKYGIIIPVGNVEAMILAIKTIMTNNEEYIFYRKKSLERVRFFTLNKTVRSYKKAFLEISHS